MSTAFPDDRSYSMGHPAVLADLLGVTGGRLLVRGLDPEVLAGVPPDQRILHPGQVGQLEGNIPRPGARHGDVVLTEFAPGYRPGVFDVVLLNAPYYDVMYHNGRFRLDGWREHNQDILSCLAYAAPGGLVAALVSADVLDAADPGPRRGMAVLADLLGAVRLPGGALRNVPGCDNPVDLLLLRRRHGDEPARGARFETSVQLRLDGSRVQLNEYFHTRIRDVLGRPAVRPMPHGPARLTVEPDDVFQRLDLDLGLSLAEIVRTATAQGLVTGSDTATTGPGNDPDTRQVGPDGPGPRSPAPPDGGRDRPRPSL